MKFNYKKIILLIIIINLCYTCEKVKYYPDDPVVYEKTIILAHRGGRNDTLRDNSYESCVFALSQVDGVEVDVQISKDYSIWLSHSAIVEDCNQTLTCFLDTYDKDIENISICNGNDISYTKLEKVFQYMYQNNISKPICIDLKGWAPCSIGNANIEGDMRFEVEKIIELSEKYDMASNLIIETNMPTVLKWAKNKNKSVSVYLVSYGDFEKGMLLALKHNMDGISYKANFDIELDEDKIYLLHKKGLKVMVWNIPDSSFAAHLVSIKADILQIDL